MTDPFGAGGFQSPADYQQQAAASGQAVSPQQAQAQAAQQLGQAGREASEGTQLDQRLLDQVRDQVTREVLLPMEQQVQAMMDRMKEQSEAQAKQIASLQAQLASAQASVGPPDVIKYGTAVAERLATAAACHGPKEAYAGVLAQADQLVAASKEAVQSGSGSEITKIAADIERFVRFAGHRAEHFPALLVDLGELVLAAGKL